MKKDLVRPKVGFRTTLFRSLALLMIIPLMGIAVVYAQDPTPVPHSDAVNSDLVKLLSDNGAQITYHSETGQVRFIGTTPGRPISQFMAFQQGSSAETVARGFLSTYSALFGIKDQSRELILTKEHSPDSVRQFERFQQVYNGIPVIGGELIVQVDKNNNILSANGETLPNITISTLPSIDAATASQNALSAVAKTYNLQVSGLVATIPQLWIYNPVLISPNSGSTQLVWRIEVSLNQAVTPIREFVLIDATRGMTVLQFSQIDNVLNRQTYTADNWYILPGSLVCDESNPTCIGGDADAVGAHTYAGATYNFYSSLLGRDSIDNAGMTLISTVHYRPPSALNVPYANAFWNGSQMVYGDAATFARADDVVAHELTHGVTDYETNLFYYFQSGAISESLSDVFGELVDQWNGLGNDATGVKWLMGEDVIPGGAIRSMSNPPAYNDPDKITSPLYYVGNADNGGVHSNSGVNNKAAYLMVDGGTFNGKTVLPLGFVKVTKLYYEVQTNLLTSGSDYADLYVALYQGCWNLIGTAGINSGDCQQVRNATDAVAMNLQPSANPNYNLDAPLCPAGEVVDSTYFFDNLESGTANWTINKSGPANGWRLNSPYLDVAHSGVKYLYADDYPSGISQASVSITTPVHLPPNTYLHFAHFYAFEYYTTINYDGGVVDYSVDNGLTWNGAGGLFQVNGYNGVITSGWGNPLSGSSAFVRETRGYISSRMNLSSLAGQDVRFRWRMGTDSSGYYLGWYLDDIRIYTCASLNLAPLRNRFTTATPTLSWARVSTATEYVVQVSRSNTFSSLDFETSLPVSQLSVTTTVLTEGTYYWRVSANAGTTWSVVDSFVVDLP